MHKGRAIVLSFTKIRLGSGGRWAAYVTKDTIDRFTADLSPELLAQLGVEDTANLSQQQIGHLFDSLRADGEAIDGRRYRSGPIDVETGKRSRPLGSIGFCLSPHKSVSILGQIVGDD